MRLGVLADIHGNLDALQAVLGDARDLAIDRWWALGDLVLFGSRPVEVLDALASLPGIAYVSGNTDRYVVTGEQPHPHETPAHAVGDLDLVERLAEAGAGTVVGGHTHDPTDRQAGSLRALNAGSVGVPRHCGHASWLVIDVEDNGLEADLREVPFDVDGTVRDLFDRGYPNAPFMEAVLTGTRAFG